MESRTNLTIKNIFAGYIAVIPSTILNIITRYVFIRYISVEYLGASGLFSSIFAMLSFADLGIGEAITYKLYDPLAKKDKLKVTKLIRFYKFFYLILTIIAFVFGLLCIPYLPKLTNNSKLPNLVLIYILYLINTLVTYLCADKKSLLIANQQSFVNSFLQNLFLCIQYLIQLLVIVFTRNFIIYLLIQIFCTIIYALSINIYCNKKINDVYDSNIRENLDSSEVKELVTQSGALVVHKIGSVLLDNLTNIIISTHLGLLVLGNYSNYLVVVNMCTVLISYLTFPTQASIGNLCASEEDISVKELIFKRLDFIIFFIYGLISLELIICFKDIVQIYTGGVYFPFSLHVLLGINFLISGLRIINNQFKAANGLFKNDLLRPIAEVIIYFVFGNFAIGYMGVEGLLIVYILIRIFSTCLIERYIVFKNIFNKSSIKSYLIFISRIFAFFVMSVMFYKLSNNFYVGNIFVNLIIKCLFTFIVYLIVIYILYNKNTNYIYMRDLLFGIIVKLISAKFKHPNA